MQLTTLILYILSFLPLPLLALQISDMEGARTIQEFLGGQGGVYAFDCRRPLSEDNPRQLFAEYLFAGRPSGMLVGMRRNVADEGYTTGYISQVELDDDNELLGYFVQTLDERYSIVWKKEGEEAIRLYQFADETTHEQYVTDGIFCRYRNCNACLSALPFLPHSSRSGVVRRIKGL